MKLFNDKIKEMLALQDTMNTKVNPDWKTAGNSWSTAMVVEAAEAIEHYGYKWWKKQTPDYDQVKLELVDIWHFALSEMIESVGDIDDIADGLAEEYYDTHTQLNAGVDASTFVQAMESVMAYALETGALYPAAFFVAMHRCNMTFNELHAMYISKNALNIFRQNNGYKQGTYVKDWGGAEDNVRLMEIVNATQDLSYQDLYEKLESTYKLYNK